MNVNEVNSFLSEKFPDHSFVNYNAEEDFGPYKVIETVIDEKISFKQIVEGLNWSNEKILSALELMVNQKLEFFERKNKEMIKNENREIYLYSDGELHTRALQ